MLLDLDGIVELPRWLTEMRVEPYLQGFAGAVAGYIIADVVYAPALTGLCQEVTLLPNAMCSGLPELASAVAGFAIGIFC